MRFKIETLYTQEILENFQNLTDNTIRYKRRRFKRNLALVLGLIGLLSGSLWVIMYGKWVPASTSFIMGIAFILVFAFFDKYSELGKKRFKQTSTRVITYTFYDENYSTDDAYGYHKDEYSLIKILCEDENIFALMLRKNSGFVLDKARFIKGDPAEFRAFIEEKTGLTTMMPKGYQG